MYRRIKRIIGLLISIPSLLLIIPICLIACIFIVIESSGNPIYIQERIGLNGQSFSIYKLRSMYQDAEKNGHNGRAKMIHALQKLDVLFVKHELMNYHKSLM